MTKTRMVLASAVLLVLAGCTQTPSGVGGFTETGGSALSGTGGMLASSASSTARAIGETRQWFSGNVSTWTTYNSDRSVREVGVTMPLSVIENAPPLRSGENAETPNPANNLMLAFPPTVTSGTFVNHFVIDYAPVGHDPLQIYGVPHFDLHFYGITQQQRLAIDCRDRTPAPQGLFPSTHVVGKPGLPPRGECVPQMGQHVIDALSPEFATGTGAMPFSKTMVLGYYAGRMTFVEPMVTKEQLMKKESFSLPIPVPARLDNAVGKLYPTLFTATYDPNANAYDFILSRLTDLGR